MFIRTKRILVLAAVAVLIGAGLAETVAAKTYRLRIGAGHPTPALTYVFVANKFMVPEITKRVAERTEHKVRIIEAYAGTVASLTEIIEATQKGTLDIGLSVPGFEQSKTMLLNYSLYFPFTTSDYVLQEQIARKMLTEVPAIQDSMSQYNIHVLAQSVAGTYGVTTNFPWKSIDDLKGKKIAVAGTNAPWIKEVGGVPVQMSVAKNYQAMQTGLLDGNVFFSTGLIAFKLHEVAKYYTQTGFGSFVSNAMFMNKKTRDGLPPEIVRIIDEVAAEAAVRIAKVSKQRDEGAIKKAKSLGVNIQILSDEQRKSWATKLAHLPQFGADQANKRGLPGSKVFQTYMETTQSKGHKFPVAYQVK